ncbi:PQQ-binding-like beta-propeller repeat protein [Actinoplanes sp. TBRC 11911]|uniref:PQQ-binding-like beta-propeller repeat protein n=1 Tax=Actinoplanes sp. TBRC 11911 TaxID=2729386 RepID=UPI00145D9261|nr:PQQ-binding-like beta-propeller repeat protein [Actinoplanes sp. TBRC 11911]NMO54190.1 PQQ-binding-like beta-propeller repeat protein [Actinoplanes sp. TBRC 11911]
MALIELDLTTQFDPAPSSPPPVHRYRLPGLILAAALVFLLSGAAPDAPRLWQTAGSIPLSGNDSLFALAGGEVYTVASTPGTRTVRAFLLGAKPRQVWSTSFAARPRQPDDVGYTRIAAQRAGDVVLINDGPSTTVLDVRTGHVLWSTAVPVAPIDGADLGVVEVQQFRAGTIYDQDSGDPGALYFGSTGQPHTEPPVHTEIHGVDLRTGATVWSVPESGSVNVLPTSNAVDIVSSQRLERRAAATGRVLATRALPPVDGRLPTGGDIIGGTMVVSYGSFGEQETGYAPDTLRRLWSRSVPEILLDPPSCGDVLCEGGRSRLDVLDPVSGKALWRAPADVDLSRRDGYVVETDTQTGAVRRLADPATGRTRVDLSAWGAEAVGASGAPIVLRGIRSPFRSVFGVVEPRRDAVQPLGEASGTLGDCAADSAHVVCRTDQVLRIWAYRA